jgi:hypothetical protein
MELDNYFIVNTNNVINLEKEARTIQFRNTQKDVNNINTLLQGHLQKKINKRDSNIEIILLNHKTHRVTNRSLYNILLLYFVKLSV